MTITPSADQITLLQRLRSREALIGVVGLGYVGLPLCLTYAEKGYPVLGLDIDNGKVDSIRSGASYIEHIDAERIQSARSKGLLDATTDFKKASDVDALILCVPTPLNKYREPDLSYIRSTMESLLPYLRAGQVLSLESTTYPGTTEEELRPLVESRNLEIGENFFLVYSPEREDPGNAHFNTSTIPKVMGGSTANCTEIGVALYEQAISEVVPVSSTQAAEMTKLLENIHRAVNIGLMNELKPLADRMGIDLYEVIRAAATKPFGFVPYYPGPGLGGHCIPIDPFYLTWKAREYGMHTRFIELAGEINTAMPAYVVQKTADALNHQGKPLKNSSILVLGIAYKKNVDDMRESPSVELMELLRLKGVDISYSDPFFPSFPLMRKHSFSLRGVQLTRETLESFDCVIIATDHDQFDYLLIEKSAQLIIDTRGRFLPGSNVVRA
ncbi:UDP-N-acetyl-D-glucosamine dehydrogenase [Synechococcus sp. WH 8020]|uniref:nucleotide sugar dehydrogenase n=1 Tax=Synechococcus sp. (strain WH8020) TaxID=32052 RepID=UPI0006527B1B|nr:nucleotide sugar dehydrogenase [Synechococcus sp. WH 8020]AKN61703.1 UDP-N-acetyl-D-glucosamine dehydrogenase [Synechococcus sp. WH 8020]